MERRSFEGSRKVGLGALLLVGILIILICMGFLIGNMVENGKDKITEKEVYYYSEDVSRSFKVSILDEVKSLEGKKVYLLKVQDSSGNQLASEQVSKSDFKKYVGEDGTVKAKRCVRYITFKNPDSSNTECKMLAYTKTVFPWEKFEYETKEDLQKVAEELIGTKYSELNEDLTGSISPEDKLLF